MKVLKRIIGGIVLPLFYAVAWLTKPKNMNRDGLWDACPNDKQPCEYANAGECKARTIEEHHNCRLSRKDKP
jgi:hypothetical protein